MRKNTPKILVFKFLLSILTLTVILFVFGQASAQNEKIFIRFNQLGYLPSDSKIAVAFSQNNLPEKFEVFNAETKKVVFVGMARKVSGKWGEFQNHAELDFSDLRNEGRHFLRFGASDSASFSISKTAYNPLADQLLEFMRQQRCGYNPWHDGSLSFVRRAHGFRACCWRNLSRTRRAAGTTRATS